MPLICCLTCDDGLKILEDESFEAESSSDSDKSDDSFCNLLDPDNGWDSDCLNSQLDDGNLGVVEDIEMSRPSPPSSLSRFASTCLEMVWEKWLLTTCA